LIHQQEKNTVGKKEQATYCIVLDFPVIESHPMNDRTDLFVHPKQLENWPEYAKFCYGFDLDKCTDYEHRNIPYVASLAQEGKKWVEKVCFALLKNYFFLLPTGNSSMFSFQNGKAPNGYSEGETFKAQINASRRVPLNSMAESEENYDEAVNNAKRVYNQPEVCCVTFFVLSFLLVVRFLILWLVLFLPSFSFCSPMICAVGSDGRQSQ
jgi:hypothetical protein